MFCGKCGTKNVEGARFCEKCGEALNDENENKPEQLKNRIASLPKNTKIVMGSVLVIVVIAIIALLILLNNPEKKVSDSLNNYYNNYKENYVKDLQVIEDVLKDHRKDSKVLKRIKDNSGDTITSWVKNLNTTYKSLEDFETAYKKVSNILVNIYSYFNGLDYILSDSLYQSLSKELRDLYSSKVSYLRGEEASDGYTKYSYFQRVIESDSYYKKAQEYIKDYTKEELTNFKEKALEYTSFDEGTTDDEKLSGYIEQLAFLNKNKIVNNIDVSSTEDYQSIYNNK